MPKAHARDQDAGCSKWPSSKAAARARLRRTFTVCRKEACDTRTPLADFFNGLLASGHGSHDKKRLGPRRDRVGQRSVCRFVRQILIAGEEPHERAAL
jgi:hypothetical protein